MTLISTTPITPEDHAMGAVASFSLCTDFTIRSIRDKAAIILSKFNGGSSGFYKFVDPTSQETNPTIDFKSMNEYGKVLLGMYHTTYLYNDTTDPDGVFRNIPDWFKNEYTEYGNLKFTTVSDGDIKALNSPNHGQELYNVSNGELGWDSVLGFGNSNGREFKELIKYEKKWLEQYTNGKPIIDLSYAIGRDNTPEIRLPYVICGRNSNNDNNTNYGISKKNNASLGLGNTPLNHLGLVALPMTLRDVPKNGTFSTANAKAAEAINNNGWYREFTHWQDIPANMQNFDTYLSGLDTEIGSNFVFFTSLGLVAAYKLLRDSFVSGNALEDDSGYIDLEIVLDIANTINPMYLLQPLSFTIDTTNTVLDGLDITSDDAVRIFKESANVFTIDIDFRNYPRGRTIRLTDTLSPSYTSKSKPVISNIAESAGVITFDTDIPTKTELYYTPRGNDYYDDARLVARDTELKTSHSFDLNDTNVLNQIQPNIISTDVLTDDVYIAVNSAINQSVLSSVQQFA